MHVDKACAKCGKKGHLKAVCKGASGDQKNFALTVEPVSSDDSDFSLFSIIDCSSEFPVQSVHINGTE
jgi:hypothetical protein